MTAGLAGLLICSLVGLFSDYNWFFDLFNHFRLQALAAAFLLLLLAVYQRKRRRHVILALIIIFLNGGLMAYRLQAFEQQESLSIQPNPIRIISANVLTSNQDHSAFVKLIEERKPDIIIALEVNEDWIDGLAKIKKNYPYSALYPRQDNFGMAIYAKHPFKDKVIATGDYKIPMLVLDFNSFALMAGHPLPPVNGIFAKELSNYMMTLAAQAALIHKPLIVVGDFNATLWSNNMLPLIDVKLRPAGYGLAWTWPDRMPPLTAVQIDHVFVRDAAVEEFKVLEGIGSDHFPIEASVAIGVGP